MRSEFTSRLLQVCSMLAVGSLAKEGLQVRMKVTKGTHDDKYFHLKHWNPPLSQEDGSFYNWMYGQEQVESSLLKELKAAERRQSNGRKKLGAPLFDMTQPELNVWVSSIYADQTTELSVIMDTATEFTAVNGADCLDCLSPTFNITTAVTEERATLFESDSIVQYGQTFFSGQNAVGTMCLDLATCAQNFPHFYISEQKGVFDEHISGVVGLARPRDFLVDRRQKVQSHKLLVNEATNSTQFSFIFDSNPSQSIDEDTENESDVSQSVAVAVNDDFFWSVQTTGVRFGTDDSNSFSFPLHKDFTIGDKGVYSILDTSASAIYISNLWFDSFMSELSTFVGTEFESFKGRTYSRCSSNFPSLYFAVDDKYLQVDPKEYVIDTSSAQDGSICLIQIENTSAPFFIFGTPLFVDYAADFDDEAMTVSFAPTKNSQKAAFEASVTPQRAFVLQSDVHMLELAEEYSRYISLGTAGFIMFVYLVMLWRFFWPEWSSYTQRWQYILISFLTFAATAALAQSIVYHTAIVIITPSTPDRDHETAEQAIAKVSMSRLSLVGLASFALHKLFKKPSESVSKAKNEALKR